MTEVVVYTQPKCQPCKATIRRFQAAGIPVKELPAADYRDLLTAMGHQQAPRRHGRGAALARIQARPHRRNHQPKEKHVNPWDFIGWLILAGISIPIVLFLLALAVAAVSTIRIHLAQKRRQRTTNNNNKESN